MSKATFISDLLTRIREVERIIAEQNESLAALRHLLLKEMGEEPSEAVAPASPLEARPPSGVHLKGKPSDTILALVQQSGEHGTRPRDIAVILLKQKLMKKGSNMVHSQLSELKAKGLVRQKADGLYVASAKPIGLITHPKKASKGSRLSPEGREAIRKALIARWAAAKKGKG